MDTVINYLKTPLTWEFKKKKAFLKSDDKTILELKTGKKRASFEADDKTYTIRNKGFWNPSTVIEEGKKSVTLLNCFFRGKTAWIEFSHGTRYFLKFKNPVFIKLSVYSAGHKEIAKYKLISKYKASMNLYMHNTEVPDMDMIFLIVLGCFIFRGIIRESKVADVGSVVFSNSVPVKEMPVMELNPA